MAWLRVFEHCLPFSRCSYLPTTWPTREPTDAERFHAFMQMNLTSDTVLSVMLPTFVLAVSVEAIQSLVWRQRRKGSSCSRRNEGDGKVHGKKAHFGRLWSECLFIRFFVGNSRSTQKIQCDGDVMAVYWILSLTRAFPLAHTSIKIAQIFGELCRCAMESGMSLNYELSNASASPQSHCL